MNSELAVLKQRFYEGELNIGEYLPCSIRESWLRCKNNALDMKGELEYEHYRKHRFDELKYNSKLLIESSQSHLQHLHESVSDAGWSILLTDANCNTLQVMRSKRIINDNLFSAFKSGVALNEHSVGTTAMSCSIQSKQFTRVFGGEHYKESLAGLNCAALPILNPKGVAIGSINLTNENPLNDSQVFYMLKTCAKNIQRQLLCSMPETLVIELTVLSGQFGELTNLIIAVAPDSTIVGCNEAAQRFLFSNRLLNGQTFHSIFDTPFSDVLDIGVSQKKSFNLRAISGVLLTARVIQPLSTPKTSRKAYIHPPSTQTKSQHSKTYFGDQSISKSIERGTKVIERLPVILLGESGVGKEVTAQHLHDASQCSGKFVSINCASIPETLIESELFGYQGGAFTGADKKGYKGRIAEAHNGTLFLDEIGDMPVAMQSRLLRVLETRKVNPLGSNIEKEVSFQLICATNVDLAKLVESGGFRKDLYYRIKGYAINLLPLRMREDKVGIAEVILQKTCQNKTSLSDEVKQLLECYDWPGNIRELRNALLYADTIDEGDDSIILQELPDEYHALVTPKTDPLTIGENNKSLGKVDIEMQKLISTALHECNGNISEAAKWLGVSRATLYRKLPANYLKSVSS
ncbi:MULTISPECIES: sigma-54-dependent Fis family transcriptional regulator [Aliiglaciecola]|uniref:sigma-54-dependent Fis family transcriptional regulator n=1 Tax=Aliiglaciecola TaxID=1406885 RepID=UPI001C08E09E|nr:MULTISPECIES: sigma-54-dependent Fis family transcriptional regulator [Aliiglaciecola]MBU2879281.1 sigma-54-dependent Fis family transcriptional regulator [Aliiglaciecola lipolytica]MDO6709733.1 sigma-54-dependent Fis family transcriptional regulator [Aliiglaciecola sp. 2_MG-2023]MDO6750725.1 sigma-54-dependent Fis family transcriptional regulator [Aliiglaciecola sp. 1_MG-2023]